MAKTPLQQLMDLLDADTQAKVRATFQAKPDLVVQDNRAGELLGLFYGEDEPGAAATTTTVAHVPSVPSAASTTAAAAAPPVASATPNPPSTTSGTADGMAAVLAELQGLKAKLDKDYVPTAKLPEYRHELLELAIKHSDDYANVREKHRDEFNEPLDRAGFSKFVAEQQAANIRYPNLDVAHDAFVKDKRVTAQAAAKKADIAAAVAEALKQQRSSATVPGQTQSVAMSPAQQVIAKARTGATNGGAESAAMRAARQLEDLDRSRASVQ